MRYPLKAGLFTLVVLAAGCGSPPASTPAPAATAAAPAAPAPAAAPVLPSWNDSESKEAIVRFVTGVTLEGGPDFVAPAERIAVFDNDGTLWSEKPVPFQLLFALDQVKAMAADHPEWKTRQPFASVLKGDMAGLMASGEKGLLQLVAATHTGMTTDEFAQSVESWITTAKHPTTGRLYTEMVYQPMLELLDYLRANGFKTFIVSGGGVEFMRPWAERTYGIPPEQVVGSAGRTKLEVRNNTAGADQAAGARLRGRQGRQAGRHPEPHRAPSDRRLRQLRRRSRDAAVDHRRARRAVRAVRPPRRRRPRVRLRPCRQTAAVQQRVGRGPRQGLDGGQHEERLEDDLPGAGAAAR